MKKMKRLSVLIPAIVLVLFLLYSFVLREKKNIVFKSTDGGQTWQDISKGLPEAEQNVNFFAGESDLYLEVKNVMYHSKSNLETPVWEKENVPDGLSASYMPFTSIAFNRSGVMAYNFEGHVYKKKPAADTWLPVYTNLKNRYMRTVFETADGTIFLGYSYGLWKSDDKGKNWKQVQKGLVMNIVESDKVLIATAGNGIMRSTDNGEHWKFVVREGGVGIAVERIKGGFAAITYNGAAKSRRVRTSMDGGKTWQFIDEGLSPSFSLSSIKQMGKYLICGHPDGIFRSSDMGKTWTKVHTGVESNEFEFLSIWNSSSNKPTGVFKIQASGNVLYAVAGSGGC